MEIRLGSMDPPSEFEDSEEEDDSGNSDVSDDEQGNNDKQGNDSFKNPVAVASSEEEDT